MPADILGVRTVVAAYAEAYAVTTGDALVPIAVQRQGQALIAAAGNALTVPAGKVFRLEGIYGSVTLLGTTVTSTRLRLRAILGSTALAATSPILGPNLRVGGTTAVATHVYPITVTFPESIEFPAGATIGVTAIATTGSMHSLDVTLLGFDYTP